jgi:hypothetical protein
MSVDFDFSELTALAASFGAVPAKAGPKIRKAIQVSSRNVKDAWNEKLYREGHAKLTGRSVTYDLIGHEGFGMTVLESEIGPKTGEGKQAGIVRLLENGSIHNAPHGYGSAALQENEADFEHGMDVALAQAEAEAGL